MTVYAVRPPFGHRRVAENDDWDDRDREDGIRISRDGVRRSGDSEVGLQSPDPKECLRVGLQLWPGRSGR